jgi:hypothetical protein
MLREPPAQDLEDRLLAAPVHLGHEVDRALVLDDQRRVAVPLLLHGARLEDGLHRDRHELPAQGTGIMRA